MLSLDPRTEAMGRDPVGLLLLRFSTPAIIGLLANALYNIVDRMFIGRIVGSQGLTAVTVAFPFFGLAVTLGIFISVGASSLVSRSLGRGDRDRAEQVLSNAFVLAVAAGLVLTLAGALQGERLLRLFGASDQVLPQARDYLEVILFGVPFLLVTFVLNGLMRAEGAPRWAMGTMLLATTVNIVLDWLFIARWGWGVRGAAWGTTIAQVAAVLWVSLFYGRHSSLKIRASLLPLRKEIVAASLAVGFSPGLMELSFVTLLILLNRILGELGGDVAVSAVGIFLSLDSLFYLPALGIGEGAQPLIGFNYGAGRVDRVRRIVFLATTSASAVFSVSWAVVHLFPVALVGLFSKGDVDLTAITVRGMHLGYMLLPLASLYVVTSYTFQALGRARAAFVLQVLRQIVFCFPLLLLLPRFMGIDGVWLSFPLMDVSGFSLALWMLRREMRRWKEL
ncbi:MATE family efflux transporter [Aminithiophilus ramosus]|uniref:Multidrug export protein MepA n=2 Tax=Synergistales TaxID=649776 RepID=A0A9Q7AR63_9BACT|nr:MATE family efflux transporter [Aminithiophilus ramosus]QVL37713.1 MATE family efflux transporter [Synergistota bacterium]